MGVPQRVPETPIADTERVREVRAELSDRFIQTGVRFMIRATLIINPIAGIGALLGVLEGRYPVAFVVNHVIGMLMIFTPAWFFIRRKQPTRALWAMLVAGTCSLLIQILVAREPSIFGFLVLVVTLPALVLPWKHITVHMFLSACVYSGIVLFVPDLRGTAPDWWTTLVSVLLIGSIFVAFGSSIQGLLDQFARASVAREKEAKDHERLRHGTELAAARVRSDISRDLHDSLGAGLTAIGLQLQACSNALERHPAVAQVTAAQHLTDQLLDEARRTVHNLRSPAAVPGLCVRIEKMLEVDRAAGLQATVRTYGVPRPLSTSVEEGLFRVAQEGVTNMRKHAHATCFKVSLDYGEPTTVCLRLQDNGQGADSTSGNGGRGLQGMRERMHALGGTIRVQSAPDQGFQLIAEVPA